MPLLRYSTSYSEPWVAWVMCALLLILLLANYFQKGLLVGSFRNLLAAKERESMFVDVNKTTAGSVNLFIYEVGIAALILYALVFTSGTFSFLTYLLIILIVCLYAAIKYGLMWLTSYIFLDKKDLYTLLMHSDNLYTVVCITLFPVGLVILIAPFVTHTGIIITLSVVASIALIIWLLKAFRLFFTNFLAGFYIFLYLCTLEIVPLVGLVFLIRHLVA